MVVLGPPTLAESVELFLRNVRSKINKLESLVSRLPLMDESTGSGNELADGQAVEAVGQPEIFIVHGHDEKAKFKVERFIREVAEARPVILHNEPNRGRTIIEKFEAVAGGAGFAVVVLTGDDIGRAVTSAADSKPRGRQNVVFELGFFVGVFGRSRVAVLHEPHVELPSDLGGLAYISFDESERWKIELARELRDAGITVDMNRVT